MIGTIAAFRTHALDRGDSAPTVASDEEATSALVRASDHIRFSYVARFMPGFDETSPNVEGATYVAAVHELASPGFFSRTYTPGERRVLTEAVGIRWTVLGGDDSRAEPVSTRVDAMLSPYINMLPAGFVV